MIVHVNGSVSVVTHKLIELNKNCMDAILKALSTIMNENRRNIGFAVIKEGPGPESLTYVYRPKSNI